MMLLGRMYLSQTWGYVHMVWNLFLAWIPFLCSIWLARYAERHPRRWWGLLIPGGLWLLFLPNAPYLVTDLQYIRFIDSFWLWYDIALAATFAWTGCFLAVVSLHFVHTIAHKWLGTLAGWAFVVVIAVLSGIGVYLGRFQRWNSWDVLLDPHGLVRDVIDHIAHPHENLTSIAVTAVFAALLLVCYLMFTASASLRPVRQTYPSAPSPHDRSHSLR